MSLEEIIRMAREAGFSGLSPSEHIDGVGAVYASDENITNELERFAHLVAAAEREAMRQDGWRRCAVGQNATQHCGLLEAAVVAEREACAAICAREARHYGKIPDLGHYKQGRGEGATSIEKKIRARGQE